MAESGTPRFMIAAEAPIIIAKACEIFVLEVLLSQHNKQYTMQLDIVAFFFLRSSAIHLWVIWVGLMSSRSRKREGGVLVGGGCI